MITRKTLKQHMPKAVRRGLERLRDILNGPGIEADVLRDIIFTPDPAPTPRLTLIMPNLDSSQAFGGVMTGLALADDLRKKLAEIGIEFRIVSEAAINPTDCVLDRMPGLRGADVTSLTDTGGHLALRVRDICMVYNWWTSTNLTPALTAQAAHFEQPVQPRIHLIQEYEPQFYAFSAAHLLAHQAVGLGDALWAVFNTAELHNYWKRQGHSAAKTYVFEPRMSPALTPFAGRITTAEKTRTILIYGRPTIPRNAFFLIRRSLEAWGKRYGTAHADWRIVSAGLAHADIPLGNGQKIISLGKLSLDDYAQLLRETAIGISLMVSPHPSYPPLEMAHFGARVLTNGYTDKSPSSRHENLIALTDVSPDAFADRLEAEIHGFEAAPERGPSAQSFMPDFLGPEEFDCTAGLTQDIAALLTQGRAE